MGVENHLCTYPGCVLAAPERYLGKIFLSKHVSLFNCVPLSQSFKKGRSFTAEASISQNPLRGEGRQGVLPGDSSCAR